MYIFTSQKYKNFTFLPLQEQNSRPCLQFLYEFRQNNLVCCVQEVRCLLEQHAGALSLQSLSLVNRMSALYLIAQFIKRSAKQGC